MAAPNLDILPDPRGLTWQDWADTVVGYIPVLRTQLDPTEDWREFARRFNETIQSAPMPVSFATWQDWVMAVKLSLGR